MLYTSKNANDFIIFYFLGVWQVFLSTVSFPSTNQYASSTNSLVLQHQLGAQQLNWILTLTSEVCIRPHRLMTQSHKMPRLETPVANRVPRSPTFLPGLLWEVPWPLLSFNNSLKWSPAPPELRKALHSILLVYYKGYNSRNNQTEDMHRTRFRGTIQGLGGQPVSRHSTLP